MNCVAFAMSSHPSHADAHSDHLCSAKSYSNGEACQARAMFRAHHASRPWFLWRGNRRGAENLVSDLGLRESRDGKRR
jgi:hypothetical protein